MFPDQASAHGSRGSACPGGVCSEPSPASHQDLRKLRFYISTLFADFACELLKKFHVMVLAQCNWDLSQCALQVYQAKKTLPSGAGMMLTTPLDTGKNKKLAVRAHAKPPTPTPVGALSAL